MPATTETLRQDTAMTGDQALAIVDRYRGEVQEHFTLDALGGEFPRFAHELGSNCIYLANAADNLAGAFKWRGAFTGAQSLTERGHDKLLVPSAGNHARGAILAAKALDVSLEVVVPESAPHLKKDGLKNLWDSPKLSIRTVGRNFDEMLKWALAHPERGRLLHPYDDAAVSQGQGTLVDDILRQRPSMQHLIVPVGGGGLLAGVTNRLTELERSEVMVHAVETTGSNSLSLSLHYDGGVVSAEAPNQRYGGSAVAKIGNLALQAARKYARLTILSVSEEEVDDLTAAYQADREELLRQSTPNFEPTSLVAIAAVRQVVKRYPGESVAVIGTGQNDSLYPFHAGHSRGLKMLSWVKGQK